MSETSIADGEKPKITTAIENLDPSDPLLRLTLPKIIEEHMRRYKLVADRLADRKNDPLTIIDTASGARRKGETPARGESRAYSHFCLNKTRSLGHVRPSTSFGG